jgi:sugar phosphate isomerase/epimerase
MKLAFSTLGCPLWSIAEIADAARQYGYSAVELRCLGGDLDLLGRPELGPDSAAASGERLGVPVCCVDTSAWFHAPSESDRRQNIELAVRFARLASWLGAPLVRVFPNEIPDGSTLAETRDRIARSLREVGMQAPPGVRIALETHGDFATAKEVVDIVRAADHPSLAIVWDVANTVAAGEAIRESAATVAPYLALVHLRDAEPVLGERFWRPVLAGRGRIPFDTVFRELRAIGYDGYVSFEWEKYWRPDLEEPEIALADFRQAVARIAAEAA